MNDISQTMPVPNPGSEQTILGHPRGLLILFLTEMWERFSYYGMRGLLIIYLTQHFLFSDDRSASIYGAYIALVYVMTIVGGTLADRYLGARKAVTFGACLLVLGHFGMAFEGNGSKELITIDGAEYELTRDGRGGDAAPIIIAANGTTSLITYEAIGTKKRLLIQDASTMDVPAEVDLNTAPRRIVTEQTYTNILYLSLALVIAGVGFLKANISTIVGSLYRDNDVRRDSGFTIFYMGINTGSLLASLTCGAIGIAYGWKYGFGLAGIGMGFGLLIFLRYHSWLEGKAEPPNPARLKDSVVGFINVELACYLSGLLIIAVAMYFVMNPEGFGAVLGPLGLLMFGWLVYYAITKCNNIERDKMLAATYFVLAQIPFWALFEQAGSSLNLFTDRLVDREFIVFFALPLSWLWIKLAKRNLNPSTPVKFALGVFLAGLGFLALVAGMKGSGVDGLTPVVFVFLIYWIHTMGELLLSPVGLSAVTKMAPARVVGMTMGAWFLYSGLSNFLSGVIARTTGAETIGGQLTNVAAAKAGYIEVYTNVAYVAMGISVVMLLISPIIKKLMHDAD